VGNLKPEIKREPADKAIRDYWNRFPCIPSGPSSEEATRLRYSREPVIPAFAQFSSQKGKRLLEAGCGPGTDFIQFVAHGAEAVGVDLSAESLRICKQRLAERRMHGSLICCDAQNMLFASDCFDFVYSFGVLHHIPEPEKAVQEVNRVIRTDGEVRVMLYHRRSLSALKNFVKHGLLRGRLRSIQLLLAECLESPGTRAFTIDEAKELFASFKNVIVNPVITYYDTLHIVLPSRFGRILNRFGWFLLVTAIK
jgi:SAM-dependent methyltransferase